MILEALVERGTGNVIVIKPEGSVWSENERNGESLIIKRISDPTQTGEFKVYPYMLRDLDGNVISESEYTIDPEADDTTPLAKDGPDFHKA